MKSPSIFQKTTTTTTATKYYCHSIAPRLSRLTSHNSNASYLTGLDHHQGNNKRMTDDQTTTTINTTTTTTANSSLVEKLLYGASSSSSSSYDNTDRNRNNCSNNDIDSRGRRKRLRGDDLVLPQPQQSQQQQPQNHIHTSNHSHSHNHIHNTQQKTDFLVGLSPEYWSHVPMNIIDVLNLRLKDGINYYYDPPSASSVSSASCSNNDDHDNSNDNNITHKRHTNFKYNRPVSKCLLVGCIVYVDRRRDGSIAYVIDDGTGLIDCIHWSASTSSIGFGDNDNDDNDDIFHLPSLFQYNDDDQYHNNKGHHSNRNIGNHHHHHHIHNNKTDNNNNNHPATTKRIKRRGFTVGDHVRVFGKIDCLASASSSSSSSSSSSETAAVVIREIHTSIMEHVDNDLNEEAYHWMKCCQTETSTATATATATSALGLEPIIDALGPDIQSQMSQKVNLPSSDDTIGYWRVFGTSCQCQLPGYKFKLLYCHCQATFEPSDPNYTFRDAVLLRLLEIEKKQQQRQRKDNNVNHSDETSATNTLNNDDESRPRQQRRSTSTLTKHRHLIFPYRIIKDDKELRSIAEEQITKNEARKTSTMSDSSTSLSSSGRRSHHHHSHKRHTKDLAVKQLFLGTFSSLRRDGIVSLLDSTTDEYIFISRRGVLEPYIESLDNDDTKSKNYINFEGGRRPKYLAKVPNERLFLVKRLLLQQSKQPR